MEDFTGRALAGEPLAYILEEWDFYGMTLYVNRDVLIPRDDTCAVTELALKKALFLEQDPRILDLCTGSGCIGLAIARKVKDAPGKGEFTLLLLQQSLPCLIDVSGSHCENHIVRPGDTAEVGGYLRQGFKIYSSRDLIGQIPGGNPHRVSLPRCVNLRQHHLIHCA